MAKVDIKLQKTIISPKKANENFNTNFQEVSKSPEPVDEKLIINTYKNVFYDSGFNFFEKQKWDSLKKRFL